MSRMNSCRSSRGEIWTPKANNNVFLLGKAPISHHLRLAFLRQHHLIFSNMRPCKPWLALCLAIHRPPRLSPPGKSESHLLLKKLLIRKNIQLYRRIHYQNKCRQCMRYYHWLKIWRVEIISKLFMTVMRDAISLLSLNQHRNLSGQDKRRCRKESNHQWNKHYKKLRPHKLNICMESTRNKLSMGKVKIVFRLLLSVHMPHTVNHWRKIELDKSQSPAHQLSRQYHSKRLQNLWQRLKRWVFKIKSAALLKKSLMNSYMIVRVTKLRLWTRLNSYLLPAIKIVALVSLLIKAATSLFV